MFKLSKILCTDENREDCVKNVFKIRNVVIPEVEDCRVDSIIGLTVVSSEVCEGALVVGD